MPSWGCLREDFPPSGQAGRALVGVTAVIVAATLVALLATTEREHPREEAAAEAAEKKAEERETGRGGARSGRRRRQGPSVEAQTVNVTEKEFSIALAGRQRARSRAGTRSPLQNAGKIQHDLAIEGGGVEDARRR